MTYWRRCSTLWKPPSHGRRLRVRPVRSPGTADIWCCDAASSGGRMSLSSWLFGGKKKSFHRAISRLSGEVLVGGWTDSTESLAARSQLMRLGNPPHTLPLAAFIPQQKPHTVSFIRPPQGCRTSLVPSGLRVPAVVTSAAAHRIS